MAKMGRPSDFTEELALKICDLLSDGTSLRKICAKAEMPAKITVLKWLATKPEFAAQYNAAREMQADSIFDEIKDIADDRKLDAQDKRVRIDARKWIAGKMRPKKYGDRSEVDLTGHVTFESLVLAANRPPKPPEE